MLSVIGEYRGMDLLRRKSSDREDRRSRSSSRSSSPRDDRQDRRHQTGDSRGESTRCLGVFGMGLYTTERELQHVFTKYGPVEKIQVVRDGKTGRSRGFGFVYFDCFEDAESAKEQCTELDIDGRRIRVDYSITRRPHSPTPGIYMGRTTSSSRRGYDRSRSRSRSYSPRRY